MNHGRSLRVTVCGALLAFASGCCIDYDPVFTFGPGDTLVALPENAGGPVGSIDRISVWMALHGNSDVGTESKAHELWKRAEEAKNNNNPELAEHYLAEAIGFSRIGGEAWGSAPMYTLLVEIDDDLIALAREQNLGRIVEGGPDIEAFDVTPMLLERIQSRTTPTPEPIEQ